MEEITVTDVGKGEQKLEICFEQHSSSFTGYLHPAL